MTGASYSFIWIDGVQKRVLGDGRVLQGYIDLHVGPLGPLSRVEAVHKVPVDWWQNRSDWAAVRTGGHTYSKREPKP